MKNLFLLLAIATMVFACQPKDKKAYTIEIPREEIAVGDTVKLSSGIKFVFTKMSTEGEFVTGDKQVSTHINLDVNGKIVWTTYEPLRPFDFVLDRQPMIAGFNQVILYMRSGDRLSAIIPSYLGYGAKGAGSSIPPNSELLFDIEVLSLD